MPKVRPSRYRDVDTFGEDAQRMRSQRGGRRGDGFQQRGDQPPQRFSDRRDFGRDQRSDFGRDQRGDRQGSYQGRNEYQPRNDFSRGDRQQGYTRDRSDYQSRDSNSYPNPRTRDVEQGRSMQAASWRRQA